MKNKSVECRDKAELMSNLNAVMHLRQTNNWLKFTITASSSAKQREVTKMVVGWGEGSEGF